MHWTVSRRIVLAFGVSIFLLLVVAGVGWWALSRSSRAYETALTARRVLLIPAIETESELRNANVFQLRYILEPDQTRHAAARDSTLRIIRSRLDQLSASARSDGERGTWAQMGQMVTTWKQALDDAAAQALAGNMPEALRIRATRASPVRDSMDSLIRRHVVMTAAHTDSLAQVGQDVANVTRTVLAFGAVVAAMVAILSAVILGRAINGPLQETTAVLASSAAEILAATTEQAAGINESMAAVSETVATVEEVTQTAAQAADRARAVADTAQRAAEGGEAGRRAVEASMSAMGDVQAQVEAIARGTVALAEQAQAIGEIIAAVSDIAEQTKMLALNAAVESARAGEHGRGFAVVAAEIKDLAGEAKQSTQQVRQLLGDVQRATNAAVLATEQGTRRVTAASEQVTQAGTIIASLGDMVADAAQAAAQIAASAGQQSLGMEQIRQAVSNIHDATQQSLVATRQSEQAARDLNRVGESLVELVGAHTAPVGSGGSYAPRFPDRAA